MARTVKGGQHCSEMGVGEQREPMAPVICCILTGAKGTGSGDWNACWKQMAKFISGEGKEFASVWVAI
jgi:hypothetical protein